MPKIHSTYICQQCGYHSSTFLGRCPQCDQWSTFVETIENSRHSSSAISRQTKGRAQIVNLKEIQKTDYQRLSTGFSEFDRVLGGGIVVGSLVLVSGDPGIGKSTLLTQLALNINQGIGKSVERLVGDKKKETESNKTKRYTLNAVSCLYVAGEESARQIKIRVDRISPQENLAVLNETDVDNIIEAIAQARSDLTCVIVDSVQTLGTTDLESVPGSIGQVRECTHRLQRLAKELHLPIFLVGHVNKEGMVAGPKTLEHVVDVVLSLEGESANVFRILRATKNRFGPTDEVGIFEMNEVGLEEVKNPSKLFLEQKVEAPGSAVVATTSGVRPILVEIQTLVSKSFLPMPRRTASGIDNNRLQLLVAVLQKRMSLPLSDKDIFVNVTGGLKVYEPAVDLGICMALISSLKDQTIRPKTAFLGEVGLLGELRAVNKLEARSKEAKKLGFTNIISYQNAKNLHQALKLAFVE